MNIKRIFTALLSLIMVLSIVPFAASAEGEVPTITVEGISEELAGLDEFTVNINISNNPGFAAYDFTITFEESAMTLVEVIANEQLASTLNLVEAPNNNSPYACVAYGLANFEVEACTLYTLKFAVADGAVCGDYAITVNDLVVTNLDGDDVPFDVENGTVEYLKKRMTGVTVEPKNVVYDGQPHTLEVVGAVEGATVTWSSTDPMINAGAYELTATVEAEGYETETITSTLTITPAPLTVADLVVADKEYDGTTTASVTYGALEGVIGSDEVSIGSLVVDFEDKNAAENKAVVLTYTLAGAAANNYEINAGDLSANITPKAITLDSVNGDSKTAAFTGVEGSDDVALNFNTVAFKLGESTKEAVLDPNDEILAGADAANYVINNTGADGLITVTATVSESNLAKVTVTTEGDDAATIDGVISGYSYLIGSSIKITATESNNKKFKFNAWYEGSVKKSANAEETFVINAPTDLIAKFKKLNTNNVASVAPGVLPGIQDKPTSKPAAIPSAKSIEIKLTIGSKAIVKNGTTYELDVPAQIVDNRTLVPLRAIFEALGATVEWDEATRTVTSTKGGTTVKLTIGDNKIYINGVTRELDVPAMIIDSRTMVPTRAIAEAYGCAVEWDEPTRTVTVKK